MDGYQKRLLDWACAALRLQALKCLGKSYLVAERAFVERCAGGRKWEDLVRLDRVGWQLVPAAEGRGEVGDDNQKLGSGIEKVVIRRPKVK